MGAASASKAQKKRDSLLEQGPRLPFTQPCTLDVDDYNQLPVLPVHWHQKLNLGYLIKVPDIQTNDPLRIVFWGCGGVGKTCTIIQIAQDWFLGDKQPPEHQQMKNVELHGEVVQVELLDTDGTSQFSAMRDLYMKQMDVHIVMYSCIARSTFSDCSELVNQIRTANGREDLHYEKPIFIVANKIDLDYENSGTPRTVLIDEGKELARKLQVGFIEISAKNRICTKELFTICVEAALFYRSQIKKRSKK